MDQSTDEGKRAGIVVVGGDVSLHYLLERYAGRIGYPVSIEKDPSSAEAIRKSEPVAVIFPSVEILEGAQSLAAELANFDIPIIVCSSVLDQAKTRELGADYCLLHPVVFDNFSSALQAAIKSRDKNTADKGNMGEARPINPV
jgi:DNA-binding response OmpR family regulator